MVALDTSGRLNGEISDGWPVLEVFVGPKNITFISDVV